MGTPRGAIAVPLPYETVALAIRRGQVAPVYLITGPDGLQHAEVIGALRERIHELGVQRVDGAGTTPPDLVGLLRTPSFVPGRLVIVDEPPWVLPARGGSGEADAGAESAGAKGKAPPEKALLDYLDAPAAGAVLVLASRAEADKRRRLTKRAAERGVLLEAAPPRDPTPWLRERAAQVGLSLRPPMLEALSARLAKATCERMDQELQKLQAYGPGLDAKALDLLVPPDQEERLYDLVDAVLAGQAGRALQLASTLRQQGEPVPRVLYALGNQLKSIVLVADACRGGTRPEAVAGRLGLHPFVAKKALDQSRRLHPEAVAQAAEAVWRAEFDLKSGRLDEAAALDAAVIGILGAAGRLA